MSDTTFEHVMTRWNWRPIHGCPGRYQLSKTATTPQEIVDVMLPVERYEVAGAKDPVLIVRLPDGGLISYEHLDATFVHTLGDVNGFRRKLIELGIPARIEDVGSAATSSTSSPGRH